MGQKSHTWAPLKVCEHVLCDGLVLQLRAEGAQRLQLQLHPGLRREDGHRAPGQELLRIRGRVITEQE
jgi:hypothetical protein